MIRSFITGAAGQDGSYLAEALIERGAEVHVLVLDEDPRDLLPAQAISHVGDISDLTGTRQLLAAVQPDQIYNLAALSSVARSWESPDTCAQVNGAAAVALMESALQVQEQSGSLVRFVQASSAEMFGQPRYSPQDESTRLAPVNPYGAAKAFAHLMVDVYRTRGLHASSLILYTHESPRRPDHFVARKITSAVAAIASGSSDRLRLGNIQSRRDWGWAPDYARAMILAAEHDRPTDFVIATGSAHSVRDLVETAFRCVDIADWRDYVQIDEDLVRPADPAELVGNPAKAHRELGWAPTLGFAEIVEQMVIADLERPGRAF